MEPQWGGEKSLKAAEKDHTLTDRVCAFKTSWAECRDQKRCRHRANGGDFSLDIHSYRTFTLIGRFCLSHFLSRRTSVKRIGPRAAPKSSCGDAPLVNAIRLSAMDTAANRRTMNTMIGSRSGAVAATVAERPSPSCRCFLSLTPSTAC